MCSAKAWVLTPFMSVFPLKTWWKHQFRIVYLIQQHGQWRPPGTPHNTLPPCREKGRGEEGGRWRREGGWEDSSHCLQDKNFKDIFYTGGIGMRNFSGFWETSKFEKKSSPTAFVAVRLHSKWNLPGLSLSYTAMVTNANQRKWRQIFPYGNCCMMDKLGLCGNAFWRHLLWSAFVAMTM